MALAYTCPPGGPSQYPRVWTPHRRRHALLHEQGQDPAGQPCPVLPPALSVMGHVDFTGGFLEGKGGHAALPFLKISLNYCALFTSSTPCGAAVLSLALQASSHAPGLLKVLHPLLPTQQHNPSPNSHQQDGSLS